MEGKVEEGNGIDITGIERRTGEGEGREGEWGGAG